jgi:hypothetical protein
MLGLLMTEDAMTANADAGDKGTAAAPPLWNPAVAAGWGLLFGPLFGVLLHRANWRALGQRDPAAEAGSWLRPMLVVALLLALFGATEMPGAIRHISQAVLLAGWYAVSGRHQSTFIASAFGDVYPRRSMLWPVALASCCGLAFMGLLILLVYIAPQGMEVA